MLLSGRRKVFISVTNDVSFIFLLLQAVVQMDGDNKFVVNLKNIISVTEINGDIITNVRAR